MNDTVVDAEATYYLAGPMSGLPAYNYPFFNMVATRLRAMNLEVRSPHEIETPPKGLEGQELWEWCMKRTVVMLEESDAIVLLPGWPRSRGAKAELQIALDKGYLVYFYRPVPGALINMSRMQ